jgi:hypothetical protein
MIYLLAYETMMACSAFKQTTSTYLVVPEPDFVVQNGEEHDMVDERLQSSRCLGNRESLHSSAWTPSWYHRVVSRLA